MNGESKPIATGPWVKLTLLVHNLRVDIQQNPVTTTRRANKLESDFVNSVQALIAQQRRQAVREAEDIMITTLNAERCDRCSGVLSPVRSVNGGWTTFCSKCDWSSPAALDQTQENGE
jgi:hypothetical protein